MRIHTAVLAFFILAGLRGFAADSPDAGFVRDAAKGGRDEIEMGKMGLQKATDQGTKSFAQHLIDDHTKMNEELTLLAQRKSIALPDEQKDDRAMMEKMANKSGMAFDRSFAHHAVKDHEKDIAAFDNEAKNGQDADVKAFAAKYAPTLRDHLKMAQDLSDKLGKGAALNDPEAEALSENENEEPVNTAVTPAEPVPQPAPAVREVEREPVNTADNVVSGPVNTAGEAVKNPVDTSVNVAGNTVNKGVDMATHPVRTAKDAVLHPIRTAKDIVTAPFKSDSDREVERSDFRDDGYNSVNTSYERPVFEDATECGACEVHESRCESCGNFDEPVYENDFRAGETSIIDHHEDCDSCR